MTRADLQWAFAAALRYRAGGGVATVAWHASAAPLTQYMLHPCHILLLVLTVAAKYPACLVVLS